eukprot:TRINITY_DN20234_c0_g1_i1.p1 TRINITY_DN20234_c0_g1~~TRINITY_DN20234_c0_g1_i1.p1  ORF type:complete len:469 (+),score=73.09 TRINITY_DN20234_c0_g1_i1:162-1568(+)
MVATSPATKPRRPNKRKKVLKWLIAVPLAVCVYAIVWPELEKLLLSSTTVARMGNCPLFLQANSTNQTPKDRNSTGACPFGLSGERPADHPAVASTTQKSTDEPNKPLFEPGETRQFTEDELEKFDGTHAANPILLSYLGRVYDVSSGAEVYGKGMSYSKFAGRACTRGVALPSLEDLDVTDDISDFTKEQQPSLQHWSSFFRDKYAQVGVLIPDPNHRQRVARRAATAAKAKEVEDRIKADTALKAKETTGKVFTASELAKFDGSDSATSVHISIAGHVLDVSRSRNLFGKGQPRGCWSGRDSTMGIIHKTCDDTQLSRALHTADSEEQAVLQKSLQYFLSKYPKVGTLEGWETKKINPPPQVNAVGAQLSEDKLNIIVSWNPLSAKDADTYVVLAQRDDSKAPPVVVSSNLLAASFRTQQAQHSIAVSALASSGGLWRFFVTASDRGVRGPLSLLGVEARVRIDRP